jgi:hypothetical protein
MKNLFLTLSVLTLSLTSYAQALPETAKQIMFDAISRDVYFEDDGYTRMPKALSDFTFTQTDEFEFSVSGTSFSDWDNKEIGYECTVTSFTRGMITSVNDIEVNCTLTNENWPNM